MSDEEQIEENIRKYIKGHSTTIKAYTQEYVDKKDKEIKILKSRLEEYQEYVEINHKEIERLNNIIFNQNKRNSHQRIANDNLQNKNKELNNIIKEQGLEDKSNYYVKGLEGSLKEYQDEVKRLNNIINKALEKSKGLQYRFGYALDDLIYLLMQGSDK